MENIVSNVNMSQVPEVKGKLYPEKVSSNLSGIRFINLKKDSYQQSYKASLSTIPFYKTSNINQYNPKLLVRVFSDENFILKQINSNPELKSIVEKYGLTEINKDNILSILDTHLTTTTAYALLIANEMHLPDYEKKLIEQACIFHDFGKILIPDKILNKPSALTPEEKEIMDLHSELGFQLLKHLGINDRVLNMIRNHHKSVAEDNDLLGQILSVADIYSALRENRAYKRPMSVDTALKILDQKAINGEVSTEVVNALKSSKIIR